MNTKNWHEGCPHQCNLQTSYEIVWSEVTNDPMIDDPVILSLLLKNAALLLLIQSSPSCTNVRGTRPHIAQTVWHVLIKGHANLNLCTPFFKKCDSLSWVSQKIKGQLKQYCVHDIPINIATKRAWNFTPCLSCVRTLLRNTKAYCFLWKLWVSQISL